MAQDTDVKNLIINKLTRAQYESIANPDPTQLYFITDEVISSSDVVNALGYTPENVANKTTTLSSSSTDTQYPSAKAVYDQIANIDTLPSQTGQSGKFLTTDGTDASWGNLPVATASTVGTVKPDNSSIKVSNDGTISAICRNVGEIITSTLPLTDAGLHLLDGSLLQYGIYKEFIDYIADLYAENPTANYFTTEALWQQSVTTYGVCGKFVYDSVNNTVRLPKITGILEGTTDVSALGDLVEAGLPNIKNQISKDNFNTVQPQTIKVLYYIVIANSTKTEIQVDIDEIVTDLNNKVDLDGTNATFPHIVEAYANGSSWYNVYSNGWCEQGGIFDRGSDITSSSDFTITLLKSYNNTFYTPIVINGGNSSGGGYGWHIAANDVSKTATSFSGYAWKYETSNRFINWETKGYIS